MALVIPIIGNLDRPSDTTTCVSCGKTIPLGQGRSCSMCYGDVDYGRDGYYRRWLEGEHDR